VRHFSDSASKFVGEGKVKKELQSSPENLKERIRPL